MQQNLFEHKDNVRLKSLNNVLDSVNARYGRDVLKIAVQGGLAEEGADKWVMKRTWLSGNYTTDIKDIIEIKA